MAIYEYDISHNVLLSNILDLEYGEAYYGSIAGGDLYFSKRLRTEDWETASPQDKIKSLFEATLIIDTLNFRGDKADEGQQLQFPRGIDTVVPEQIENASYEIAILLLGGLDPQLETQNQNLKQVKFGPISTEYSESRNTPPHVSAGIYSAKAWRFLYPFIRQNTEVNLTRV